MQYTKVFGALEIREKKRREGSGSLEGVFFYVALSAVSTRTEWRWWGTFGLVSFSNWDGWRYEIC